MSETTPKLPTKFYRIKRFYWIVAGLIALTVTPTIVYYEMSYNSVNGTAVQLVSGRRSFYLGVTFYLEIHVWSWATSISTHVSNPIFNLVVDSFPIQTVSALSGSFEPGGYVSYNLKFQSSDTLAEYAISNRSPNNLFVQMSASVSAGFYQEQVTEADAATWTFSS